MQYQNLGRYFTEHLDKEEMIDGTGHHISHPRKSRLLCKLLLAGAGIGMSAVVVDIRSKLSNENVRDAKGYRASLGSGNLACCSACKSA